jgi:hypothetical protein
MPARSTLSAMSKNAIDAARDVVREHGDPAAVQLIDRYFSGDPPALQRLEELVVLQSLLIGALSQIVDRQVKATAPRKRGRPRKDARQEGLA